MPTEKKKTKRWKPKETEAYFDITTMGSGIQNDFLLVLERRYVAPFQDEGILSGNCFRTRRKAELAVKKINRAISQILKQSKEEQQ